MTADPMLRTQKAWPIEEAGKLADRLAKLGKTHALFQTGYGPSGLPHIGTFGEVARTSWVRHAFSQITGLPSRLLAFSDDMDGLRKAPDNVPNRELLLANLGKPLTKIPDPFGTHSSFGAHNNARLRAFLDAFGFDYEFASSTDYYTGGRFDEALLRMAEKHEEIRAIILPTLGPDRRATYSPFLPIHPLTGVVMQVPMEEVRADGTLVWRDEGGQRFETPVTAGHCKAQWKADWALRWYALGVDYEMSGKDLIDSVRLSSAICRALGAEPPVNLTYELFLDETGQKISKSKGNGLTIDEWLRYAPPESLSQFMYNQPTRAKRLYFDVIPRAVDEYLQNAERGLATAMPEVAANPAWHIHAGHIPPSAHSPLSFQTLLNLAAVSAAETPEDLWAFVRNYAPDTAADTHPFLNVLVARAVAYCEDFVRPHLKPRAASAEERAGLEDLITRLQNNAGAIDAMPPGAERAKAIQDIIYDAGRRDPFTVPNKDGSLGVGRGWFNALYQVLLGADEGPRFGSVIAAYGIARSISVIQAALAR